MIPITTSKNCSGSGGISGGRKKCYQKRTHALMWLLSLELGLVKRGGKRYQYETQKRSTFDLSDI